MKRVINETLDFNLHFINHLTQSNVMFQINIWTPFKHGIVPFLAGARIELFATYNNIPEHIVKVFRPAVVLMTQLFIKLKELHLHPHHTVLQTQRTLQDVELCFC